MKTKHIFTIITHNQKCGPHIPPDHATKTVEVGTIVHPFTQAELVDESAAIQAAEDFMFANGHVTWRIPELCSDETIFDHPFPPLIGVYR